MKNLLSVLTDAEVLNKSLDTFTEKVQDFIVIPGERYAIKDNVTHFATPKFTANLIELINMAHEIFNNPVLDALQKESLENGLYRLSKALARAECDRNIANSVADEKDEELKRQIIVSCEQHFIENYQDIAAFRSCVAAEKHLSNYRFCFPIDPPTYDKIFPDPDPETKQYIVKCRDIKAHVDMYTSLYTSVFASTTQDLQTKRRLDESGTILEQSGPSKRRKLDLQ